MSPLVAAQRPTAAALVVALGLLGCRTTSVQEHDAGDVAPSVRVKAYWTDDVGEKRYVGGLLCQLVRHEGEPELVASEYTATEEPLYLGDLEPGRYRLVVRGGGFEKESEEFEVRPGKRVTVRVDVEAAETRKAVGDAVTTGLTVAGGVVLVSVVVAVLVLAADDDEDEDEDGDDED